MTMSRISRRNFVKLMGAGGALSLFGLAGCETAPSKASGTSSAKAAPRVVVIGGGFGGATCAKYLRLYDPGLNVTLVEQNASYVTCPGSNWMLGGLRKIEDLTQNYDALRDKQGRGRRRLDDDDDADGPIPAAPYSAPAGGPRPSPLDATPRPRRHVEESDDYYDAPRPSRPAPQQRPAHEARSYERPAPQRPAPMRQRPTRDRLDPPDLPPRGDTRPLD